MTNEAKRREYETAATDDDRRNAVMSFRFYRRIRDWAGKATDLVAEAKGIEHSPFGYTEGKLNEDLSQISDLGPLSTI